ncbi:hypothetical protein SGFS_044990 [Streptomyces graminofaciens]|uniref:HTH cro/C1-type domain-containing protein n=1 Tax=Streptomyces graminofaciens TaxID=68212 RepID=A0ABN5VII0_9ACTN|nr:helix-turn-helix domain-containing protein [Streptomyces graminofaciens]BBC33205.1 hypothetical protein SGFS_044990 [Streptomyces graminofaciens]
MTVPSDRDRNVEPVGGLSESFGAAVRARRLEMGLTQENLASRAGMSQGALSRLEHGRGVPTLPSLERLAEAMESNLLISLSPSGAVQVAFRAPRPQSVRGPVGTVGGVPSQRPAGGLPSPRPAGGLPSPRPAGGVPSPRPADGVSRPRPASGVPSPRPAGGAPYSWRNGGTRPTSLSRLHLPR